MRETITREDLRKIDYLDASELGDRIVNLMPFWDQKEWHWWIPTEKGLTKMRMADAAKCQYLAVEKASQSDLYAEFVDFMWQRASFPEATHFISAIIEDFNHLGTSLAKLKHFHEHREAIGHGVSDFAETELEYVVLVTRSVFDLLQETIGRIWNRRISLNGKEKTGKIPDDSFAKVVLEAKERPRTEVEIGERFGLPREMAVAYAEAAPFFFRLRDFRDSLAHSGKGLSHVYVVDAGFAFGKNSSEVRIFDFPKRQAGSNENLVLTDPFVDYLIASTITACNRIVIAFGRCIQFPKPIAPGLKVFMRGFHSGALIGDRAL